MRLRGNAYLDEEDLYTVECCDEKTDNDKSITRFNVIFNDQRIPIRHVNVKCNLYEKSKYCIILQV